VLRPKTLESTLPNGHYEFRKMEQMARIHGSSRGGE
jgi:hypothetical protein